MAHREHVCARTTSFRPEVQPWAVRSPSVNPHYVLTGCCDTETFIKQRFVLTRMGGSQRVPCASQGQGSTVSNSLIPLIS